MTRSEGAGSYAATGISRRLAERINGSICGNPECNSGEKTSFHHFYPRPYRHINMRSGMRLCMDCHRKVHTLKTNRQLVDEGYTTAEKIIKLLAKTSSHG